MSIEPERRISDRDRESVADQLGRHVAIGHLNLAEFDTRVQQAYAARTAEDLESLLADLPSVQQPAPAQPAHELREQWAVWGLVNAICVGIWLAVLVGTGHVSGFWPIWVIGPWGVVLLARTTGSRGRVLSLRS